MATREMDLQPLESLGPKTLTLVMANYLMKSVVMGAALGSCSSKLEARQGSALEEAKAREHQLSAELDAAKMLAAESQRNEKAAEEESRADREEIAEARELLRKINELCEAEKREKAAAENGRATAEASRLVAETEKAETEDRAAKSEKALSRAQLELEKHSMLDCGREFMNSDIYTTLLASESTKDRTEARHLIIAQLKHKQLLYPSFSEDEINLLRDKTGKDVELTATEQAAYDNMRPPEDSEFFSLLKEVEEIAAAAEAAKKFGSAGVRDPWLKLVWGMP